MAVTSSFTRLRSLRLGSTHIGLGIGTAAVRAIAVERGRVLWAVESGLDGIESVAGALARLVSGAPIARWPRPPVVAAIGPGCAQTKRISGLPTVADAHAAGAIIRESASRFFLRNGVPLVVSDVAVDECGAVWAAAFAGPVIDDIESACRQAGLRLYAVVPAASVLGAAMMGDRHVWIDGDASVEISTRDRRLTAIRRLDAAPAAETCPASQPVPALAAVGENAARFADAYGAAVLGPSGLLANHLFHRPGRVRRSSGDASRKRLGVAAAAACLACVAVALAPSLSAEQASRSARAELAELAERYGRSAAIERELHLVTGALAEFAAFESDRRSPTLLLAGIARALPESTAVAALRVDSAGGTIVALGEHGASLVSALERVRGVAAPELVGPVTREVVAERELERVTVRFRLTAATDHSISHEAPK